MNSKIKNHTKNTLNTLTEVDLLVVGAGVGGLELAYQISEKWKGNKSILVVDQADYVGGRVRSVNDTYKFSRLSCQLTVSDKLEGMIVNLPKKQA